MTWVDLLLVAAFFFFGWQIGLFRAALGLAVRHKLRVNVGLAPLLFGAAFALAWMVLRG